MLTNTIFEEAVERIGGQSGSYEADQLPVERPGAYPGSGFRRAITPEIEKTLPEPLLARLREIRSKE